MKNLTLTTSLVFTLLLGTVTSIQSQAMNQDSLYAIWSDTTRSELDRIEAYKERFKDLPNGGPQGDYKLWMADIDSVINMVVRNEKEDYYSFFYMISGAYLSFEGGDPVKGCEHLKKSNTLALADQNIEYAVTTLSMMVWTRCIDLTEKQLSDSLISLETQFSSDIKDPEFYKSFYLQLGGTLQSQSRFPEAIRYFHMSKVISENIGELDKVYATTLSEIANIHREIGNNKEAIRYYLSSLDFARKRKDTQDIGSIYISLAELSINDRDDKQALIYLDTALYIMKEVESCEQCYIYARKVRAGLNNLLGNYNAALEELMDLEDFYKNFENVGPFYLAEYHNELAETYLGLKQYEKAEKYAKMGLEKVGNNYRLSAESIEVLFKTAEAQKDYRTAYRYHMAYSQKRDSMAVLRNSQEVTRFELENQFSQERFEDSLAVAQQQLENQLAFQAEINRQKNSRNIIIAFGIVLLLLAITLFSRLRYVRKTEAVLKEKNRIIEKEKEKALASEKAKHQFLANMSHEIRTPMNAIKGMTDILLRREPKPEQKEYLSGIKQSSDSLLVIINDILDLSKVEAGKIELEKVPFSPGETITNVRTIMQYKAEEKGLELRTNIPEDLPNVIGDPSRLHQVLVNLVGNAVKFTEKGMISVSVKSAPLDDGNTELQFMVSDTGVGIDTNLINKIFESFEQAYSDTSRKFGGTGLGLSICKKLVELQGGEIWVESDKGKGSKFFFSIPYPIAVDQPVEQQINIGEELGTTITLKGTRILLVEDNAFNAIVAQEELEDAIEGVKVELAENGAIAVAKLESGDYDVVLMDVQMPVMNGFEATHKIRSMTNGKSGIPIIAMTANVLKEEVDKCYEAGMDDFIGKPFDTGELLKKIGDLLARHSS